VARDVASCFGVDFVLQLTRPVYVSRRHSFLRGPLTLILALWALALPALLLVFAAFGPIGLVLGVGAAVLLIVPWLIGLVILAFVRALT
jgi:hypothetical protein